MKPVERVSRFNESAAGMALFNATLQFLIKCHYTVKNEIKRKYIKSFLKNIIDINACTCINID